MKRTLVVGFLTVLGLLSVGCNGTAYGVLQPNPEDLFANARPIEPDILDFRHLAKHVPIPGIAAQEIGVDTILSWTQDVILAPDVQGASTVRWKLPNAITIFVRPPSLEELEPRLAARGTESDEERRIRLATAEREMQRVSEYDYVIINQRDRLDLAVRDLKAIITAERLRVCPRTVTL